MLSLHSLIIQVIARGNASGSNPWQLSLDVEGESPKVLDVHTLACLQVVAQVLHQ